MVKKIVVAAAVIAAGLAAYNLITTGKLTLIPSSNLSPEEQQLNALESRIHEAAGDITRASQAAGLSGLDTTSDVESAMRELERAEKELQSLKQKTNSEAIKEKCDRLMGEARSMRGRR